MTVAADDHQRCPVSNIRGARCCLRLGHLLAGTSHEYVEWQTPVADAEATRADADTALIAELRRELERVTGERDRALRALLPSGRGDDVDMAADVLARAHRAAEPLIAGIGDDMRVDGLDTATLLAFGFALLTGRLIEWSERAKIAPRDHRCGWCHASAGGTDEAWLALPTMDDAGIKAHTATCEHNPIVLELATLRAVLDEPSEDATAESKSSGFWFAAWKQGNRRRAEQAVEIERLKAEVARLEAKLDSPFLGVLREADSMREVVAAAGELVDNWREPGGEDVGGARLERAVDDLRAARARR